MNKELLKIKIKETTVQISNGDVKAIRSKDLVKSGARVYKDGLVGVAGQYGEKNIEELFHKAEENLRFNIKYPCEISKELKIEVESGQERNNVGIDEIEALVKEISKVTKDLGFIASGNIKLINKSVELNNDENLNCSSKSTDIVFEILLKELGSPNIFDTAYMPIVKYIDSTEMLKEVEEICRAHKNPVDLPISEDKTIRCVFSEIGYVTSFFENELSAQKIGTNSSYFINKFGEKIFNEALTMYPSNNIDEGGMAFDYEGTEVKGEEAALILDGVLIQGYADKRDAKKYNLNPTGSGFGEFNSVPSTSALNLNFKNGKSTIKELIGEKPAVLIYSAGGGDFTNDGGFGTPVQIAYLFDGEKLVGKVPEFSVKSHIYEMFGENFVGVASDSLKDYSLEKLLVMDMKVN